MLDGDAEGFMSGAMSGAISGAISSRYLAITTQCFAVSSLYLRSRKLDISVDANRSFTMAHDLPSAHNVLTFILI